LETKLIQLTTGMTLNRVAFVDLELCNAAGTPVSSGKVLVELLAERLFRILRNNVLCSMATIAAGNRAHINTAYFCCSQELELYFLSHPDSVHCRNLAANSSMAVTVFSSAQDWRHPGYGLQLFGNCSSASGPEGREAERLYAERFPAYTNWRANLKDADLALQYRFYRFVAGSLKLLDEEEYGDGVFLRAAILRTTPRRL
jgi:uncharacterized protein YhbP (UPF0306 family)